MQWARIFIADHHVDVVWVVSVSSQQIHDLWLHSFSDFIIGFINFGVRLCNLKWVGGQFALFTFQMTYIGVIP